MSELVYYVSATIYAQMTTITEVASIKGITFGSLNIRGVSQKTDEIAIVLEKTNLDFLFLQETFLTENVLDTELEISGYRMLRLDRDVATGKKTGGGLVSYFGNQYKVEALPNWSISKPHLEVCWLKLLLKDTRPTFVANVYRPPDGDIDLAIESLNDQLADIMGLNTADIIIFGDLNIDMNKRSAKLSKYKSFLNSNLLHQIVKQPTRITNTSRTIIDHILTNNEDFYNQSMVVDPGLSDHAIVVTSRKRLKLKYQTSYFLGRSYRKFNEEAFYADVARIDWNILYESSDVNGAANLFTKLLVGIIDKHAPIKCIKCRSDQPKWVNSDFLSLIDEKKPSL